MARLACDQKLGYYPANPVAIAALLKHLRAKGPDPSKKFDAVNILDPCCGKGEAIKQIADGLGVDEDHVYTVELDRDRTKDVKALMPRHHHLGPASFLGTAITGHSFGLAYVNSPFGDELGAHRREEMAFIQKATPLLVTRGVLVAVMPLTALAGNYSFVDYLDSHYEDIRVYKFPDGRDAEGREIRPYKEIAVIGRKRREPLGHDHLADQTLHNMELQWRNYFRVDSLPALGELQPLHWQHTQASFQKEPDLHVWEIPHSWRPNTFKKTRLTDEELVEALANSPLNKYTREVQPLPPLSPPLPLDRGHLGICIASGILDGVVQGPYGPHVVRGSSHKELFLNRELTESTMDPETGAVTTKEVRSERLVTVVRFVDRSGVIFTQSNAPKERGADDEDAA